MNICFVTYLHDPKDISSWSGTCHHILKHLEKAGVTVICLGSLKRKSSIIYNIKHEYYKKIKRRRFSKDYTPGNLRYLAKQIKRGLKKHDIDIILAPFPSSLAALNTEKPIVLWADATFINLKDYYEGFSDFCKESLSCALNADQNAFNRSRNIIFSSDWAAQAAIHDYHVDTSKVSVIPFGANIHSSFDENSIKKHISSKQSDICKLLFLGKEWDRKGGELSLQIADQLAHSGMNIELVIAGCMPEIKKKVPPYVTITGFLDKKDPKSLDYLKKLFLEAHFLLLPTQADCTPIVLNEANSFGVPCITTNVGGIPSVISDGVNGFMFDKDAPPDAYCATISKVFSSQDAYRKLAFSSFNEYQKRLNWDTSIQSFLTLISPLTNSTIQKNKAKKGVVI